MLYFFFFDVKTDDLCERFRLAFVQLIADIKEVFLDFGLNLFQVNRFFCLISVFWAWHLPRIANSGKPAIPFLSLDSP